MIHYRELRIVALVTLVFVFSMVKCSASSTLVSGPTVAEQYLLAAANRDRASRGLQELHQNPSLTQAAFTHAKEMALHGGISHQFEGEPELSERGAAAGAHFSVITENVAETPDPTMFHELWMHSEGHRANLLDPSVDAVGIAIVANKDEFFAVEDFANTVETRSFTEQESAVTLLIVRSGLHMAAAKDVTPEEARETCRMSSGYATGRRPYFVIRYTADTLTELPSALQSRLKSGNYHEAAVGACSDSESGPFTGYNIAVLLYP
jgi:hypothetical protein